MIEPQPVMSVAAPVPAAVSVAAPAPAGNVLYQGIVSRDDDIAAKEALTVDGIVVKVKDTDGCPLDADIELRVNGFEQEYHDLPIGSVITAIGRSGQVYYVNLLDIDDDSETISFTVTN